MTTIELSGVFGWEITAEGFRSKLASARGGDLEIVIASVGGDVFEGIDIYNQLSEYKRKNPKSNILVRMGGVVASMASYLSMNPSIDMVVAEDNAAFMIHNAWSFSIGDHHQMRKDADMLEGLSLPMAKLVSAKMGIGQAEAEVLMKEETWFFGEQIVEAGFASDLVERPQGGQDRDEVSARAEMKRIQSEIIKKAYASKAVASVREIEPPKATNKTGDQNEMNESEIRAQGVQAEKERVKSLMEIKAKYKDTPAAEMISGIVDKAIEDGSEKADVLTEIQVAVSSGNVQAALESPPATPQGGATTASGEILVNTEDEGF